MVLRANRLRRVSDRVEDWAAWVLLAGGLLVILLSCVIGVRVHDQLIEQGRGEALDRTPGIARLLATAPTLTSEYGSSSPVTVAASWRDRSGVEHAGSVSVPQGLQAGSTVLIWTDRSGSAVPPPTSPNDALLSGVVAAGLVIGAAANVLACIWALVRHATLVYNCGCWEREWRAVEPVWTRGEGSRG
jgi:hypothetical protein